MTQEFGFGWVPSPLDCRDWPVSLLRNMVDSGNAEPVAWNVPNILHQGTTPRCVGYSLATLCSAQSTDTDVDPTVTNELGDRIYLKAKEMNGDTDMSQGTYLRSGAQAAKDMGLISAYAMANYADAEDWCTRYGPVVIGVPWYRQMSYPDDNGVIHAFQGDHVGGHAICWAMNNQPAPENNGLPNTWGHDWGKDGWCYMSDADLAVLLMSYGEAVLAVKNIKVPWSDWGNDERLAAVYVHAAGLMAGYPDGTFKPYQNLTYRQVHTVATRAGLNVPKAWHDMWGYCTRAHVRDTFPEFEWNTEEWDKPYLRRHLALQLYRWKKGTAS